MKAKPPHHVILEKDFAGIAKGAKMLISRPAPFLGLSNPVHLWRNNWVLIQLGLTYTGNLNLDSGPAVRMDYRANLGLRHKPVQVLSSLLGTFISGFAYHGLDVLHQKEQVKRIGCAGFKLPIEVPQPGRLVLRMHQQCTNSGNVRRLCSAQQRIFEQCFPQTLSLIFLIYGKSGKNHHRNWMLRNSFDHTRR